MDIYETIQDEIKNFTDQPIEIVPGYTFNQYDTIKRNHLYLNSKFEDNSPYNGREKIFDNIVSFRCEMAATLLDFDTKDSRLLPLNPISQASEYILAKELELYLKNKGLDKFYNDLADDLPIYGSVVIKKSKDKPVIVDLRRLFNDPTVDTITESRFIILKHYLTASQLRAKKGVWDDEVIDLMLKNPSYLDTTEDSYEDSETETRNTQSPYYVVYERYGEVPESFITGKEKDEDYIRAVFITSDPECGEAQTLYKSEWKGDYPFLDAHYKKTKGRWLGVGVIEELWNDQERKNELANQLRVGMEVSSMVLFQTSDQILLRNVLTDKQTGDVLKKSVGGEGLQPVDNRIKNFQEFISENQKWDLHADRMSFSNDVMRGGDIPASTPATNAVIQNNNSTSVFKRKRQRLGDMLRKMFNDWILPDLKKNMNKEHILRFMGDAQELQVLDKKLVDAITREKAIEAMLNGEVANVEAIRASVEQQIRERGVVRDIQIEDAFFKDMEFEYDVITDGQQKNLQTDLSNSFAILQSIGANPAMLDDPRTKALVYEWMQQMGMSPMKLELADSQRATQVSQQPLQGQLGGLEAMLKPNQQQNV